jgi:hypothetical protein
MTPATKIYRKGVAQSLAGNQARNGADGFDFAIPKPQSL